MTERGKYNPQNPSHTSSLWRYGEVPVPSSKLNAWNGNIEDALSLATTMTALLFGAGSADFVLHDGSGTALQAVEQSPPNMTIRIKAGYALVSRYFAGLDADQVAPAIGTITSPAAHPRVDRVCIDREGRITLIEGEESTNPEPPGTPPDCMALADIRHRPGETCIKETDDGFNAHIIDMRPLPLTGRAHRHNTDRAPIETANGDRTVFHTLEKFVAGTLDVYVNGVLQRYGSTTLLPLDDQRGYEFATAPPAGYVIEHRYQVQQP